MYIYEDDYSFDDEIDYEYMEQCAAKDMNPYDMDEADYENWRDDLCD